MIRHNIAVKIFLSVLTAFILMFTFQAVVLNTFVVAMYNKRFIQNAENSFYGAAIEFTQKRYSDEYKAGEAEKILDNYTTDNSAPVVAFNENGEILDKGILSGNNIVHVKNLRGESMYIKSDYLASYIDSPLEDIKANVMYRVKILPLGIPDFYKMISFESPSRSYTDGEFLNKNPVNNLDIISQFVYYVETVEHNNSENSLHRKALLFNVFFPEILSGENIENIVDQLNNAELTDSFGNRYIIFGYKVYYDGGANYFLTLRYYEQVSLVFEYMSNYYVGLYAFFIIIAVILIYFYSKQLSGPLIHLSNVARRLSMLDFSIRAKHKSPDQLGQLSDSLNTLSDNLQTALSELHSANEKLKENVREEKDNTKKTKTMLEELAHELKTPLGIISGFTELVEYNIETENHGYYFEIINTEINKLTTMINDTIDMSKIESGYSTLDMEAINIKTHLDKILLRFMPEIERRGFELRFNAKEYTVLAHRRSITKVIDNLISNMFKHSQNGKFIEITIKDNGNGTITLYFGNAGNLTPTEIDNIWERHNTADANTPFMHKYNGIGLTIVSRMLKLHGSEYGAYSENGKVVFHFTLKLVK